MRMRQTKQTDIWVCAKRRNWGAFTGISSPNQYLVAPLNNKIAETNQLVLKKSKTEENYQGEKNNNVKIFLVMLVLRSLFIFFSI